MIGPNQKTSTLTGGSKDVTGNDKGCMKPHAVEHAVWL